MNRRISRGSLVAARREFLPWMLLGVTLGLVEGATAAVLLKQRFGPHAALWAVNLAVGFVSAAPAIANIVSFAWANWAHGRERVPLLVRLQALFAASVGLVGLVPQASGGLVLTTLLILLGRALWAGILTVRSAVWIANYPRYALARMTSRIVIGGSVAVAVTAGLVALALASGTRDARLLYVAAALAGLAASLLYRRTRVRRQFEWLRAERAAGSGGDTLSLRNLREVLRDDPAYREYMLWMGLFGGGALMLTSQLVIVLTDQLGVPPTTQILTLSVIPLLTLPLFMPWWARLFDRTHTVSYRARQGWAMVIAVAILCAAAITGWLVLLWIGAIAYGIAMAGANLGWSFGHHDFAPPGRAQLYMGVHVTLTGLRGLLAPPLGIAVYQALESWRWGSGRWSLLLPLAFSAAGALGFHRMRRRYELNEHATYRP